MKNLWFINLLLLLLFTGCVSVKPRGISKIPEFPGNSTEVPLLTGVSLYKAVMEIGKHRLTGLMVIKRMDSIHGLHKEQSKFRVVFANEIGMTFLDLEILRDSMRVVSCFSSLNRKKFLEMIASDFRLITGLMPLTQQEFFRQKISGNLIVKGKSARFRLWNEYNTSGDTLTTLSGKSNLFDPVFIRFGEWKSDGCTKISLRQPVIGMNMELRRLKHEPSMSRNSSDSLKKQ
jgi:hypothetical protein